VIQGAKFVGAYPVIAVDIIDSKLEMAKHFGATHTVNASKVDPVKEVINLTYGRGADYVIMAVAGLELLRKGWDMSAVSGTTCIIGHGAGEWMVNFEPVQFCLGRTLTGSAMGGIRSRIDIPRIIELYENGILKLDELVSGHFKFDEINKAFDSMEKGNVIRNVLTFD
jgi:S-(hydroxymethyl)glutathione dehydrogenase/alcohol dehydrogenase